MVSNILSVFNPAPSRDLDESETRDCVPCQVMSTLFSLGFGSYLVSGKPFEYCEKDQKKGISLREFNRLNPQWWRITLRSAGGILLLFGLFRGTEGWLWNRGKIYKKYA
ncbi:LAMI_0E15126g1_1 [Lachancea mirantina]|uniref:LAMI_0E15126g1_1 n=1 Tax=Lachancea mirantina TaxID=1230905 RepID=A0A1G4JS15_9SACH|nr:LAMI_0E15126g1_1 [Lachancea mirantina]